MGVRLVETPFDPGGELNAFSKRAAGAGGIATFSGHVRPEASGEAVLSLTLKIHPRLTLKGLLDIEAGARGRWPLLEVEIIHRHGEMRPGEAIVFVATASAHRRAAFEAADFLMDYLKTRAVFWKKESRPDGDHWIEPREDDYADVVRWA